MEDSKLRTTPEGKSYGSVPQSGNRPRIERLNTLGGKRITAWGSFCLNLNNCQGPAMVILPLVCQEAGWITPVITMSLIWFLSSSAGCMLCEAMQRIPGNSNFDGNPPTKEFSRYEFGNVVKHYYGIAAYNIFNVMFVLCLTATNIVAMVISAQVVDVFTYKLFGSNFAFDYSAMEFIHSTDDPNFPWGEEHTFIISTGLIACILICVPFGYLNLEDNMCFQYVSLAGLATFTSMFVYQFAYDILRAGTKASSLPKTSQIPNKHYVHHHHPFELLKDFRGGGQHLVLGTCIFTFAFVVTIPSWVNEKKRGVSVNKSIWYATLVSLIVSLAVGLLAAQAYVLVGDDGSPLPRAQNILNILLQHPSPVTQYSAYLWDLTTLVPGIPILAIVVRYNMLVSGWFTPFGAFVCGVVVPWVVTAMLYEQRVLIHVCNWAALILQGFVNLVVPCMLYYRARLYHPYKDECQEYVLPEPTSRQIFESSLDRENAFAPHDLPGEELSVLTAHDASSPAVLSLRRSNSRAKGGGLLMRQDSGALLQQCEDRPDDAVEAIPRWLVRSPIWARRIAISMATFFLIATLITLYQNICQSCHSYGLDCLVCVDG